jgi:SAM-dependent methyltransferase
MSYDPETIFRGAAWYYARYRTGYMPALFDHLVHAYRLDGSTRVVDAGCGTGQLTVPLAQRGVPVVALDPEAEMLDEARAAAEAAGVAARVGFVHGRAEELAELVRPPVRLVCFGASFHWTDRDRVLALCDQLVEPGAGGVAVISGGPPTRKVAWESRDRGTGKPTWADVVTEVIQEFLGPRRRAGSGFYEHPHEGHEQILRRSAFGQVEKWSARGEITRHTDEVIGLQYSTSYCSPTLLGERKDEFERVLRARLVELVPTERFVEEYRIEALCATR